MQNYKFKSVYSKTDYNRRYFSNLKERLEYFKGL